MKFFLFETMLIIVCYNISTSSTDIFHGEDSELLLLPVRVDHLRRHVIKKINQFKNDALRLIGGSTLFRHKRNLEQNGGINKSESGEYAAILSSSYVIFKGKQFLLLSTDDGVLYIFLHQKTTFTVHDTFSTVLPASTILAFSMDYENLWVIAYHQTADENFIQLYVLSHGQFHKKQRIDLHQKSVIVGNFYKDSYYLAIASSVRTQHSSIVLYLWKGSQFDIVASIKTGGYISALATWNMDGLLYLAPCFRDHEMSPILTYRFTDERLHYVQYLETSMPITVRHFSYKNSYYLLCTREKAADLFVWTGNQFLKRQILQTDLATDIVKDVEFVITTDKELFLIFVCNDDLKIFMQDSMQYLVYVTNLQLSAGLRAHGIVFSIGFSLYSAVFIGNQIHISEFPISPPHFPLTEEIDPLHQCLLNLQASIHSKQQELDEIELKLPKVWRHDSNETVSSLIVNGNVIAPNSFHVQTVIVITNHELPLSNALSPFNVLDTALEIEGTSNELDTSTIIDKSSSQKIFGFVEFTHPVSVDSGNISSVPENFVSNGVPISRLQTSGLKRYGAQFVQFEYLLGNLVTKNAVTKYLNSIPFDDLLLLTGSQSIEIVSLQDVLSTDIHINGNGALNDVQLFDVVNSGTTSDIHSVKYSSKFSAKSITSSNVNKVNFSKLVRDTLFLGYPQRCLNNFIFTSTVVLETVSLRGDIGEVDVMQLAEVSLKKHHPQNIRGTFIFMRDTNIVELNIKGMINGVITGDIVTSSSDQEIYGNFAFSNTVMLNRIVPESVNNIKLQYEAVHAFSNVSDHKIFLKPIHLKFDILMNDKSLIDNTDPSEMRKATATSEYSEFRNIYFRDDVVVLGQLITGENISFPVHDLRNKVWLKRIKQDISYQVFAKNIDLSDLVVQQINNLDFLKFVPLNSDAVLIGTKKFGASTFINGYLILNKSSKINGITLSDSDQVVRKNTDISVLLGKKTFSNLVVLEDLLNIESLNGKTLYNEYVLSWRLQDVAGNIDLRECQTVDVTAGTFSTNFIKSINFSHFITNAVKLGDIHRPLHSKSFGSLKTIGLNAEGLINGLSLKEFSENVVYLDSDQIVVSKILSDSSKFISVNVIYLFYEPISFFIENLLLLNNAQNIEGQKVFEGLVQAESLNLHMLNRISLTSLQLTSILKSESVYFHNFVVLKSDIVCGHLVLDRDANLDGVYLGHAVRLNSDESMLFSTSFGSLIVRGNAEFHRLVNQCNITQIFETALLTNSKKTQVITSVKNVISVFVTNLLVKCTINDVTVDRLESIFIDSTKENDVLSSNFFFDKFSATQLHITNNLNPSTINLLLNDAVLRSVPFQVIKYIRTASLSINNLQAAYANIHGFINGLNFTEMYMNTVLSVMPDQRIHGLLELGNVNAQNVSLSGSLNGVQIPRDLVLSHSKDLIDTETFVNSSVKILTDFIVSGRMDSLHLGTLLNWSITLDAHGNIYSSVIFEDDVKIVGPSHFLVLNGYPIKNLVTHLHNRHFIKGVKTFTNDLVIRGDLNARKLINGQHDVSYLGKKISRLNHSEEIKELVFQFDLIASSLNVKRKIGSQILNNLWDTMHDRIDTIDKDSSLFIMEIQKYDDILLDYSEDNIGRISDFAYFEIHQSLALGPTKMFVPVQGRHFSEPISDGLPVKNMMAWVENVKCDQQNNCCKRRETLFMKVLSNGTLIEQRRYHGLAFHVILCDTRRNVKGFLLQSKYSSEKGRCNGNIKNLVTIKTYFENKSKTPNVVVSSHAQIIDAEFMEMEDIYLVVAYSVLYHELRSGVVVYKYDWLKDKWLEHQYLERPNPTAIDITVQGKVEPTVFLAVGYNSSQPHVIVYQWDFGDEQFHMAENVFTSAPDDVLFVGNSKDLYLLVANEQIVISEDNTLTNLYVNPVQVFKFSDDLVFNQSIDVRGINFLKSFSILGETYIVAVSRYLQTIYIIQHRGYSGFQVIQEIPAAGVESAAVFAAEEGLMLAVASITGHTKILKAIIRGT